MGLSQGRLTPNRWCRWEKRYEKFVEKVLKADHAPLGLNESRRAERYESQGVKLAAFGRLTSFLAFWRLVTGC